MHRIPDIRVWGTANEYQESSVILSEAGKGWSAAILAALAIEIYLKCFLSKEVKIGLDEDIYQSFKETERGHKLTELFYRIPKKYQDKLVSEYQKIGYKHTLLQRLERYNNLFFDARYIHEQSPTVYVDNLIVTLAEDMRNVVANISTQ